MKNKKIIIIISAVLVIVLILVLIFFFSNKKDENVVTAPIRQTSMRTSSEKISIDTIDKWVENNSSYLWQIQSDVQLEKVQYFAEDKGLHLSYSKEGFSYHWVNNNQRISYNLATNVLSVVGEDLLSLDQVDTVTAETFSKLMKKYFDLDLEYEVFKTEKGEEGQTTYFAKRIIDGNNPVEMEAWHHQTDHIAVKDGKILFAKLLLARFINTNKLLPLVSKKELKAFVNQLEYPKIVIPNANVLLDEPEYEYISYDSEKWEKINKTIRDCNADKISVVYLYKDMSQENLTPVYKIEAQCKMTYDKEDYFIPSTWYVNAINPELILLDDK